MLFSAKVFKLFSLILVTLLITGGFYLIFLVHRLDLSKTSIISPIISDARAQIASNIWLPQADILGTGTVEVNAQSAFFIEAHTGQVLYAKNLQQKVKIASLTKIMTAIVALENQSWDHIMVVPDQVSQIEPDKMDLGVKEKLTLKELIAGMFLISANDAAETVAEDTFNDRVKFIQVMNQKALTIGMLNTKFTNPTGLDSDDPGGLNIGSEQYSTAYDVGLMARYLIAHHPEILDITSQSEIDLPAIDVHQAYYLPTSISLVQTYPGVVGLKTGYTDEAGYTLVTVAKKNGAEIIGVILGDELSRDDARRILDYSFSKLGLVPSSSFTPTVKGR